MRYMKHRGFWTFDTRVWEQRRVIVPLWVPASYAIRVPIPARHKWEFTRFPGNIAVRPMEAVKAYRNMLRTQ